MNRLRSSAGASSSVAAALAVLAGLLGAACGGRAAPTVAGGAPGDPGSAAPAATVTIATLAPAGRTAFGAPVTARARAIDSATVSSIAVDGVDAATLYVAAGAGGVYRSTDAGIGWSAASEGLPHELIQTVVTDPVAKGVVYAVTARSALYKSTDGAAHWALAGAGLPAAGSGGHSSVTLFVSPADPRRLVASYYLGGSYASADGGATFAPMAFGDASCGSPEVVGFSPSDPLTLYANRCATLVRSRDGGHAWAALVNPLDYTAHFSVDPTRAGVLYACAYPLLQRYSTDDGATWSEGGQCDQVASPADPTVRYWVFQTDVFRSNDSGITWTGWSSFGDSGHDSLWATSFVVDHAGRLHVGTGDGVYSAERAGVWDRRVLGLHAWNTSSIAVAPHDSTIAYATGDLATFVTRDGGATWAASFDQPLAIQFDATDPRVAYGDDNSGLFWKTEDGGATWRSFRLPDGVEGGLVVDVERANAVYTNSGGRSLDGGATWSRFEGLPGGYENGGHSWMAPVLTGAAGATLLLTGDIAYSSRDGGTTWRGLSGAEPLDSGGLGTGALLGGLAAEALATGAMPVSAPDLALADGTLMGAVAFSEGRFYAAAAERPAVFRAQGGQWAPLPLADPTVYPSPDDDLSIGEVTTLGIAARSADRLYVSVKQRGIVTLPLAR